jgi:GTPase SAR1 family protein
VGCHQEAAPSITMWPRPVGESHDRAARALWQVSTEEAQAYADENGLYFLETSAKTNVNVNELFQHIAKKLPRAAAPVPPSGGITLTEPMQAPKKSTCC